MDFEPAMPYDAEEIVALQKLAYASEDALYSDLTIPPMLETAEELRLQMKRQLFLKLCADGQIVACGRAYEQDGTCHIGRLVVHPRRQGQGLGSQLVAALEARFPAAQRYELFTGSRSLPNLRLYQRLGYLPFREQQVSSELTLVYLEKLNG